MTIVFQSAKYEKSIHDLETKITDLEKQLEEQQSNKTDTSEFEVKISDLEQKLADSQQELEKLEKSKTDTVELENKIRELERRAKEDGKSRESLQAQIQEYDSSYTKLQTQVTQYRSVLGETVSDRLLYFFSSKMGLFPLQNNAKNLDPSYKRLI